MIKCAKIIAAILVIAFTAQYTAAAEKYSFRVLAKKGNIEIQTKGSDKWVPVKTGQKVFKSDKIKLDKKSYIGLVHNTRKTLELKKAGEYTISDLNKQVAAKKSNISGKFASLLVEKMGDSGSMLASNDSKNNMKVTGAADRGMNGDIIVKTPTKQNLINKVITIEWIKPPKANGKYNITLSDRFDKPVFQTSVTDTKITIDTDKLKLNKDQYYLWRISMDDPEVTPAKGCFLVLSDKEIAAIKDTLKILSEELGEDESATANVIMASFYESNLLMSEAISAYETAVSMAPGIDTYQKIYDNFKARIKLAD